MCFLASTTGRDASASQPFLHAVQRMDGQADTSSSMLDSSLFLQTPIVAGFGRLRRRGKKLHLSCCSAGLQPFRSSGIRPISLQCTHLYQIFGFFWTACGTQDEIFQ